MRSARIPVIRAVVFDFDGTLTKPGSLDFQKIRNQLGCPTEDPVLEFISELEEEPRLRAHEQLDRFEYEAAELSVPNEGAEKLLTYLKSCAIPCAIVSRNSLRSVLRALENFDSISAAFFDCLITRDDLFPPKPDPATLREAADRMGVQMDQVLTVGDYIYDVQAGSRAGGLNVYLSNSSPVPAFSKPPDYMVECLEELQDLIARLIPLPAGKLPNRVLAESLAEVTVNDEHLLVGPGVGEDVAAIQLSASDEVLVLKTDPITFATSRLGYYAVVINANDLATAGARPRWLLTTLLLPRGTNAASAQQIIQDVDTFSAQHKIQLCGGHTEITDAVTQPIVVAQLAGTVARSRLVEKKRLTVGNRILLTKSVGIEGTAVIAHEFSEELRELGISELCVSRAQHLLYEPGISILEEAEAAAGIDGVSAMHDVTEGGLATALEELSTVSKCRISIDRSRIRILPETAMICRKLDLDPLGLLGSGSLLISCTEEACNTVVKQLESLGIPVEVLGLVKGPGKGVETRDPNIPWPKFETDEISRAFDVLKTVRSAD